MDRRLALLTGIFGVAAVSKSLGQDTPAAANDADLDEIGALLRAHDEALTNHDLKGVMASLADNAMIMGTGPSEIWMGTEELQYAYENFFKGFDKGAQTFDYQFRVGGKSGEIGWLMSSGVVTSKKDGKEFSYPLNISLSFSKIAGSWKISGFHYSTDPGTAAPKE